MTKDVKPVTIYKWEYKNFLTYVKKGHVSRAMIYAKALKIDRRTLVHWMSQKELREAMLGAIDKLIDGMQNAGREDWRMWREMLKMLGVNDELDVDIKSAGEQLKAATIIDLGALNAISNQPEAGDDSGDDQSPQS